MPEQNGQTEVPPLDAADAREMRATWGRAGMIPRNSSAARAVDKCKENIF